MASMTRDQFVAELQARGWSRFTAAQLQKYLDWALQDVYQMGMFNSTVTDVAVLNGVSRDIIPFAEFVGVENLITNPGFEIGVTPWTVDAAATLVRSTAQAQAGVASGLLTATSPSTNSRALIDLQDEVLVFGTRYRISAWVYGSGTVLGKNVRTTMFETGGAQASENVATSGHPIAAGWKRYAVEGYLHQVDRTNIQASVGATATEAWATNDFIHIDEVECGVVNPDLVQQIQQVFVQASTEEPKKLEAVSEAEFQQVIWPNTKNANPIVAALPDQYYVYDNAVYFYPKPTTFINSYYHYLKKSDNFVSGTDLSGLPERFDKAILMQAVYYCAHRAKEWEEAIGSQTMAKDFVFQELGQSEAMMNEKQERSLPWRA